MAETDFPHRRYRRDPASRASGCKRATRIAECDPGEARDPEGGRGGVDHRRLDRNRDQVRDRRRAGRPCASSSRQQVGLMTSRVRLYKTFDDESGASEVPDYGRFSHLRRDGGTGNQGARSCDSAAPGRDGSARRFERSASNHAEIPKEPGDARQVLRRRRSVRSADVWFHPRWTEFHSHISGYLINRLPGSSTSKEPDRLTDVREEGHKEYKFSCAARSRRSRPSASGAAAWCIAFENPAADPARLPPA